MDPLEKLRTHCASINRNIYCKALFYVFDSNSYHHLQNEHIVGLSMTATETVNLSKRVEIIGQRVIFPSDFYRSRNLFATRAVTPAGLKYKCSFKALPHKLRFLEQKATVCPIKMKIHVMYGPKDILVTSPGSVCLAYLCYLALLNHFKHLKPFHMNSI